MGELREVEEFGGGWGFKELMEFGGLREWECLRDLGSEEALSLEIWEAGDWEAGGV